MLAVETERTEWIQQPLWERSQGHLRVTMRLYSDPRSLRANSGQGAALSPAYKEASGLVLALKQVAITPDT